MAIKKSSKKRFRLMRWLLVLFLITGVAVAGVGHWFFDVIPKQDPESQFTRENIMNILSGETRVFYRDGSTLQGAFFDANHRVYVPYAQIPPAVINALVSAEDAHYFQHGGFDARGFLRAVITNVRAGSMVQGGSTLTQQTAKNIFGREEKSLSEKFKELQNALRLEKHFSKQDILEFYLNQFYVAGTGRGVSIAAWHFFSKDLSQLSLAECAFIAGSVKGPAKYDPFNQKTPEGRDKAIAAGKARLQYVLRRMLEEGYITQAQHDEALKKPLEFRMGQFRFALSTSLERIEEKLNSPYYKHLFDSLGIDSWQKHQLKVISTMDAKTDNAATTALQSNLADLQMKLGGFSIPKGARADNAQRVHEGDYLYGSVDSMVRNGGHLSAIFLRFGILRGEITKAELDTFAVRHHESADLALAKVLAKGSVLMVRVLDSVAVHGVVSCRLETEPVIQGALVALQDGQVLAAQGGFHNTSFDRVNRALRQFGSSWKPLLFTLAFTHGWHYTDTLENTWNLFQLANTFYFPRPDHEEKAPRVSVAWAAARSENIAAIWMLDHLLDHLNAQQMHDVAVANGFLAREGEPADAYKVRLRDTMGLVLNDEVKAEINFAHARDQLVQQLRSEGQHEKAWLLGQLAYGRGAVDAEKDQRKTPENIPLLRYNYKAFHALVRARSMGESNAPDSMSLRGAFTLGDFVRLELTLGKQPAPEGDYLSNEAHLFAWPDYRRMLAMVEFVRFAHAIGVHQNMQPVQSMPLGTNDVTLIELATAYQTIFSGRSYKCKDSDWNEPCLIAAIKDANGKVLFHNEVESKEVLSDSVTQQVAVMLRETFESGTARGGVAAMVVRPPMGEGSLAIPVAGKTGTTNDYRNVAFLGALPSWDTTAHAFRLDHPVTIGSYVGFDDNKTLQNHGLRIAGATGALPPWVSLASEIVHDRNDAGRVDFLDLALMSAGMVPWYLPLRTGDVNVDPQSGLPAAPGAASTMMPWLGGLIHAENH